MGSPSLGLWSDDWPIGVERQLGEATIVGRGTLPSGLLPRAVVGPGAGRPPREIFWKKAFSAGTIATCRRLASWHKRSGSRREGHPGSAFQRQSVARRPFGRRCAMGGWSGEWPLLFARLAAAAGSFPRFEPRSAVPAASPSVPCRHLPLSPEPGRGDTHASP